MHITQICFIFLLTGFLGWIKLFESSIGAGGDSTECKQFVIAITITIVDVVLEVTLFQQSTCTQIKASQLQLFAKHVRINFVRAVAFMWNFVTRLLGLPTKELAHWSSSGLFNEWTISTRFHIIKSVLTKYKATLPASNRTHHPPLVNKYHWCRERKTLAQVLNHVVLHNIRSGFYTMHKL